MRYERRGGFGRSSFDSEGQCEVMWAMWGNAGRHRTGFEGVERLCTVRQTEGRFGVLFVKCRTPPRIVRTTCGDIWPGSTAQCWGLHPLSGAVSCAALKHCLHIVMLISKKAAADVKHLVLLLFTCKEIMCPVVIFPFFFSCFVILGVIKKSRRWRPSSLVAWLQLHAAGCQRQRKVCFKKKIILVFHSVPSW